jgi:hypothetical protein
MKPRTAILVLSLLAPAALTTAQRVPDPLDNLRRSFVAPPLDSRIMMRWWWFGPAVTEPELERELRLMKAGGIGGVEVQPVYPVVLDDPAKGLRSLPYLSDEFITALRFAADKARELELRMDLTIGSGWPYGGPQVGADQAAGKLRIARVAVTPLTQRVAAPSIGAGEQFIAAFLANVDLGGVSDGAVRLPDGHGSGEVLFFIASRTGMMVKRAAVGAEGFVLERTRNPSRSSAVDRFARGNCTRISTSSLSRGMWSRSTRSPPTATRRVWVMVSALMPWRAAFSLSITKRALGWSASMYQSVSTTPLVLWNV